MGGLAISAVIVCNRVSLRGGSRPQDLGGTPMSEPRASVLEVMSGKKRAARHLDATQLLRQWKLLRILSGSDRWYSINELAEQLGSSKSTVERDLATVEQLFPLIEQTAGKQRRLYRVDQRIRELESVRVSLMELLAVHAASAALGGALASPFHADLQSLLAKIRGVLSQSQNGSLDAMARVFLPHLRGGVDYSDRAELIDDIVDAIATRRVCRVDYLAAWRGRGVTHVLHPYRLLWHDGALYLAAWSATRRRLATFTVHRILKWTASQKSFPPSRRDVEAAIRPAFGIFTHEADTEAVEILFSSEFAWRVEERVYHPDERKVRLPDGRLRYQIRSSSKWEIIPWVLGFGGAAELVKPASWREELRRRASELNRVHASLE